MKGDYYRYVAKVACGFLRRKVVGDAFEAYQVGSPFLLNSKKVEEGRLG
jgi:hypothetical protein